MSRNRSEGWAHAKLSGHELEDRLTDQLQTDCGFSSQTHDQCFGSSENTPPSVKGGGVSASHVDCVIGGLTPSKSDLIATWKSGNTARLSLKKSKGGQVWLVTVPRFCDCFNAHYGRKVPQPVQDGLKYFIGPVSSSEMKLLLGNRPLLGPIRKDNVPLEEHQNRFVAETLQTYFQSIWKPTLDWLQEECGHIAELCFSHGLCSNKENQAGHVWYYIEDEKTGKVLSNTIFPVSKIIEYCDSLDPTKRVIIGPRNGGSTLQLPFGFLQMHRPAGGNQMQFHHGFDKLRAAL